MRIHKPRGLTTAQLLVVTTLGFFGGIYIWQPLFEEHFPRKRKKTDDTESGTNIALVTKEQEAVK